MEITNATVALAALGQTTRLAVFRLLVEAGPSGRMAGEIAEALGLPGATLSFHLKELVAAGLVQSEARGRRQWQRHGNPAQRRYAPFVGDSRAPRRI